MVCRGVACVGGVRCGVCGVWRVRVQCVAWSTVVHAVCVCLLCVGHECPDVLCLCVRFPFLILYRHETKKACLDHVNHAPAIGLSPSEHLSLQSGRARDKPRVLGLPEFACATGEWTFLE